MKIGLVGCGKQAPKHLSGLRKIGGIEVVLADADPAAAKELGGRFVTPWVVSVDELFAMDDVVAVDVCTPTHSHAEMIERALNSGKDFFCEKPLTDKLEVARDIEVRRVESGRIGMVGYVYRFAPIFEIGRQIFRDVPSGGRAAPLGRVVMAQFRLGGRGSHQVWKHMRASGGGAINEMLVHMVDLALWYFGDIEEIVHVNTALLRPSREINGETIAVDADDFASVQMHTVSGVEVFVQADLLTPAFRQHVEVQGENGTFFGSIQPENPSFVHCIEATGGWTEGRTDLSFGTRNLFEAQMAEFVRSVRSRKDPDRCSVSDSIRLLETMQRVVAS